MWSFVKQSFLVAGVFVAQGTNAQIFDNLNDASRRWSATIEAGNQNIDVGVGRGNCVIMSPDQSQLIATSIGGTVSAYNPFNGERLWGYDAPQNGITRSHSCVAFPPKADMPYMVYAVVDNENSAAPTTRVIALDMSGDELWVSEPFDGINAGTPVVSTDGSYIFFNRNTDEQTSGHFTILSYADDGTPFFSQENTTSPFGALGVYHEPIQGMYEPYLSPGGVLFDGVDNVADILVWSVAPKPDDRVLGAGKLFAFQFPKTFDGTATDLDIIPLGPVRTFQTDQKPVFTNAGRTMYMSVSQSGFRGWIADDSIPALARDYFSESPEAREGFGRYTPYRPQAPWAPPALGSDVFEPIVFGGSAAAEFCSMNFDMSRSECVTTTTLVRTQAKVTDGDEYAIYIEAGEEPLSVFGDVTPARLHMALNTRFGRNHLSDVLLFDIGETVGGEFVGDMVEGEFALKEDQSMVYIGTVTGKIHCLQIGEIPETPAPTMTPSASPTISPAPTPSPTAMPVPPTQSPSANPTGQIPETPEPTIAPTGEDTSQPSASPSFDFDITTLSPSPTDGSSRITAAAVSGLAVVVAMLVAM